MKRKEPISTDAMVEASWQAWLAVVAIAACILFVSALQNLTRDIPPELVVQNCPPLTPAGSAYGPYCF